ncbi:Pyridoxine-5'-phosphate oxidase like protein [Argiope bruennichi]|uniref:pyridoxal 5'-phosphate synthase n=1 Tax=Argiope bruennichi TaxID=94029 RepID=A0A8T0EGQ9_ARGBR|nr:Pyridoxine-5'-phosphate oxidase like protein [Argiope bruennichi]
MSKTKPVHEIRHYFSPKDPFELFTKWYNEAEKTEVILNAETMVLATATKDGKPSVRYMLMKSYNKEGFTFYTNYNSRKGQEIIVIEGQIVKNDAKVSEDYFHSRPKSNQLTALISNQGEVIEDIEDLVKKKDDLRQEYLDEHAVIPKPDHWGGYVVKPDSYEFFCGHQDRLNERIKFRRPFADEIPDEKLVHTGEDGWIYQYLSP